MTLKMPDTWLAAQKIAGFESFRSEPYEDSRVPPVPTIGYGCTVYPDGRPVTMQDAPCSQEQALDWLHYWVSDTATHLWPFFQRQPTLHQFSAFLSLAYNEGWPSIARSTAVRLFNSGNLVGSGDAFLMWDKVHHDGQLVESDGLRSRREAERAIFLTPDDGK